MKYFIVNDGEIGRGQPATCLSATSGHRVLRKRVLFGCDKAELLNFSSVVNFLFIMTHSVSLAV